MLHFNTQRMDPSRPDHRVVRYSDMVLESRAAGRGAQLIIATHDVLFWSEAHRIELARGYFNRVLKQYAARVVAVARPSGGANGP